MSKFLETIKVVDGEVFHIEYHQRRYESVLKSFGIGNFVQLKEYINPPQKGFFRCRVIYDLSSNIKVEYVKYQKKEIGSFKLVFDDKIEYRFKYLNRKIIDDLYKNKKDCDEIIIVKNSYITDTSIANIAFFTGFEWITPKYPLLYGTTRQRYIESNKIKEVKIDVDEIYSFEKVALLNAMVDFDIIPATNLKDIIC